MFIATLSYIAAENGKAPKSLSTDKWINILVHLYNRILVRNTKEQTNNIYNSVNTLQNNSTE